MTAYIFVTGGVVSGLGKGVTAASIGCLLKNRGLCVSIQKLDPYLTWIPAPCRLISMARCSSPTTARRRILTWDTTSASWMRAWTITAT